MPSTRKPSDISYRKTSARGASQYGVSHKAKPIGKVGRFQMGAAQFGSTWTATTPSRKKSTRFRSREAAAAWLVEQASR